MNTISSISNEYANALSDEKGAKTATLGKDDFLKLLVAQMENQDPLNPTDPTEFTSQLSQFSSLEQLYNVNANLGDLQTGIESSTEMASLGLIGKRVMSDSNTFRFEGETVQLGYGFANEIDSAILKIQNDSGKTVTSLELGADNSEDNIIEWDGTDWFGNALPHGRYSFSVIGYQGQESIASDTTLVQSEITGVDLSDPKQTRLITANGEVNLADVERIVSN